MKSLLRRTLSELGALGLVSLAIIAGAAALENYGVKPLESRERGLAQRLERQNAHERMSGARARHDAAPAAKLDEFYRYFEGEKTTDSLARLNKVATANGVELRSADYRLQATGSRIGRYEITLPLSGSYAHIRAFLERALIEIPVLSLDQISFHRKQALDATVQAEARFTLHILQEELP